MIKLRVIPELTLLSATFGYLTVTLAIRNRGRNSEIPEHNADDFLFMLSTQ